MKMEELKRDIEKLRDNWDERSSFTLGGVKGLSVADLDTILLYADAVEFRYMNNLMAPIGKIAQVLNHYNLI